jgi:hypothetical protein
MNTFIVLRNNEYTRVDIMLCDKLYWWAFHGESTISKIDTEYACDKTYAIWVLCRQYKWKLIGEVE